MDKTEPEEIVMENIDSQYSRFLEHIKTAITSFESRLYAPADCNRKSLTTMTEIMRQIAADTWEDGAIVGIKLAFLWDEYGEEIFNDDYKYVNNADMIRKAPDLVRGLNPYLLDNEKSSDKDTR